MGQNPTEDELLALVMEVDCVLQSLCSFMACTIMKSSRVLGGMYFRIMTLKMLRSTRSMSILSLVW